MKNRQFRFLSLEDKQRILMFVLRDKTKNELTKQEEDQLLSALSRKNQFHIRVYTDMNEYLKASSYKNGAKDKVIFGEDEFERMKALGEIPRNAIAVISENECLESRNQVYIFIPPCRKSYTEYIKEKLNSEHVEAHENNLFGCDLFKLSGVTNR